MGGLERPAIASHHSDADERSAAAGRGRSERLWNDNPKEPTPWLRGRIRTLGPVSQDATLRMGGSLSVEHRTLVPARPSS